MSTLNQEYDTARFVKSITKTAPQPVPIAVPKSEPVAKPQPVKETKPVDRQAEFAKRYDDELGGTVELLMHPEFFSETGDDTTVQNAVRVFQWVLDQGKWVSRSTVNEAIKALKKELTPLRKPEPPPQPKVTQTQPVVPRPTQSVISDSTTKPVAEADNLPELPAYVIRVLGNNRLRTRKDVHAVPSWLFSELYRGPHAAAFKARIHAIGRQQ